jgi:hypothetical protein
VVEGFAEMIGEPLFLNFEIRRLVGRLGFEEYFLVKEQGFC